MKSLVQLARNAEVLVARNSPAFLTAFGVVGTVATAVLAVKAGYRSGLDIATEEEYLASREDVDVYQMSPNQKIKLTWKQFIPPALTGTSTVVAIIMANRIGARRTAAVTAAFAITERAYDEYREKARELYGDTKERKIRDAVAHDQLERATAGKEIILPGDSKVLCLDSYSGRLFESTVENIKAAQNNVNYELINNGHASLADFYNWIGLPTTPHSHDVGWNCDRKLEIEFTWGGTDEMKPCVVVTFQKNPFPGYYKLH